MEELDLMWTRLQLIQARRDISAQYEAAANMRERAARMHAECVETVAVCSARAEAALLRFTRSLGSFE